jgi:hypothetical protein
MAGPPVFEGLPQPQTGTGDWVRANNGTLQKVSVTVGGISLVIDPSVTPSTTTAAEELTGDAAVARQMTTVANSGQSAVRLRRALGTLASPTTVGTGNGIGLFEWYGYDGTAYRQAASIGGYIDGVPSGDMPGGFRISTTSAGNLSSAVRWTFRAAGHFEPISDLNYDVGSATLAVRTVYANAHYYRPGTVGALPTAAAGNLGWVMLVSDALGPVKGAAVVGGGAVYQLVVSTGAAWNVL